MIEIILKMTLLNVIWVIGWKIITEKNMLLEKIGEFGEKQLEKGHKIFEGLITCSFYFVGDA